MTAASTTAPACDPATLRGVCAGGCGRLLHYRTKSRRSRACVDGHPRHSGGGLCSGCHSRARRAAEQPQSTGDVDSTGADGVDLSWQQEAACRGAWPELFFPEVRAGQNAVATIAPIAERYCADCPVRVACDRYAEATRSVGLWAGVWRRYRGSSYTCTPVRAGQQEAS